MKTTLRKVALSFLMLLFIGAIGLPSSYAACGAGFMTVELVSSTNAPLAGGTLYYKDAGWQTATEDSPGVFCVPTSVGSEVKLRMEYAGGKMIVTNVPTNATYTFQTVLVTFEFRKRNGALGINFGEVEYHDGTGWAQAGHTGSDGLGTLKKELLPLNYNFRLKFVGTNEKWQDVSANPVVVWQRVRVTVNLLKPDNTRGYNGGRVEYRGHTRHTFGITGAQGETGRIRQNVLPATYNFTMYYKGGKYTIEDYVVTGETVIDFTTCDFTAELFDGATPIEGGKVVSIGSAGADDFGMTAANGMFTSGLLTGDTYCFRMEYECNWDIICGLDCNSNVATFDVSQLHKSGLVSGQAEMDVAVYPNPFVGNTTVAVSLEKTQNVIVAVYDITGKLVTKLYDGTLDNGNYRFEWDGQDVTNGLYICRITTDASSETLRIVKN